MALIHYLTRIQFDHEALNLLPQELALVGVTRPLLVTDPGVQAAGLSEARSLRRIGTLRQPCGSSSRAKALTPPWTASGPTCALATSFSRRRGHGTIMGTRARGQWSGSSDSGGSNAMTHEGTLNFVHHSVPMQVIFGKPAACRFPPKPTGLAQSAS